MKKLVFETLDEMLFEKELFESKAKDNEKPKPVDVKAEHAKSEKSKVTKPAETKESKAEQAIAALKDQIAKAKKPGAFKTTKEKTAKIAELEAKVKAWEKKK